MKRYLLVLKAVLLFTPLSLQADDFCMDCVQRWVQRGDTRTTEASCCTADSQGDCYVGDWMVNQNVGHGCRVSEPDPETGGTSCVSQNTDPNCGAGTGGGAGGGTKTGFTSSGCVYDANGYCDVSCSRCTFT